MLMTIREICSLAFLNLSIIDAGSSSIEVKDENSGTVYHVGAHVVSSSCRLTSGSILISLLLLIAMLHGSIF